MAYPNSKLLNESNVNMPCRKPPPATDLNPTYDRSAKLPETRRCYKCSLTKQELNDLQIWQDPNMYPLYPPLSIESTILCDHFENKFAKEAFSKKHFYDSYSNDCVNQGFICNWCSGNYNVGERSGSLMRCRQCGKLDYSETQGKVADACQFPSS